jgi:hypothetical protein
MTHSSRSRRALTLFTTMLALLGAGAIVGSTNAFAANCSGYGCDNRDPIASGCNDARTYTVASDPLKYDASGSVIGWLDLRYSPTCGTNWSRVRSNVGVQYLMMCIRRKNETGLCSDGNYSTGWSNMVYAPTPIVACASGGIYVASVNRFATDYVRSEICY